MCQVPKKRQLRTLICRIQDNTEEVYVTDKHEILISQFERFAFQKNGVNLNGENELQEQYTRFRNMTIIELLYYGYFGAGNNVNMNWLDQNGFWAAEGQYPTEVKLTPAQFKRVLTEGNINVSNVVIN